MNIKKFVVIGPESTGKTTLCKNLADHFKAPWVAEYAREYLESKSTTYNYTDLAEIAKGQLALEQQAVSAIVESEYPTIVILDTNLLVIKIWSEYVFNKCDNTLLTSIANMQYDGYLLCNTDIPWVKDNLREYPNIVERQKLFVYYKEELSEQSAPWVIIEGDYEARTTLAIRFINAILKR